MPLTRSLHGGIFLCIWLFLIAIMILTAIIVAGHEWHFIHLVPIVIIVGIIAWFLGRYIARIPDNLQGIMNTHQRLLQDISHELRSPLARLHVAIELGRKKTGKKAIQEFDRMEQECIKLNEIISEILTFARLEHQRELINPEYFNLDNLINAIVADANYEYGEDKPRVTYSGITTCNMFGNPRLVHRAIENILRNSLNYSNGQVQVTLVTKKHRALITITDNGPGVPAHQLANIFLPFYRVDPARTEGGYGLGLAIAHEAIILHKGLVNARNVKPHGLCISITLPITSEKLPAPST